MLLLALLVATAAQPVSPTFDEVTPDMALMELRGEHEWRPSTSVWDSRVRRKRNWNMRIEYSIDKAGRVGFCDVVSSSGSNEFDQAACGALRKKVRVVPAFGADGLPKRSKHSLEASEYFREKYLIPWICVTDDRIEE